MNHSYFIEVAWAEARASQLQGGVDVGAVLVKDEKRVVSAHDQTLQMNNPIAVAEMECIRQAGRRDDQSALILYSTRYPDMLVAGTVLQFSIGAMVIGLPEAQSPAIDLLREKSVPITFWPMTE
ncbi:MAG: nucleoside deaminase [Gammaproteobacteria bacterium]|nr:nucleoside deaminase [Gammaproteobacteria bacterium]